MRPSRCHSMGHEHSQRGRGHRPDAKPCIDPDQDQHSGSDGQQSDLAHLNAPLHSAHQFHPEQNPTNLYSGPSHVTSVTVHSQPSPSRNGLKAIELTRAVLVKYRDGSSKPAAENTRGKGVNDEPLRHCRAYSDARVSGVSACSNQDRQSQWRIRPWPGWLYDANPWQSVYRSDAELSVRLSRARLSQQDLFIKDEDQSRRRPIVFRDI